MIINYDVRFKLQIVTAGTGQWLPWQLPNDQAAEIII
jgi:hypothetical protein